MSTIGFFISGDEKKDLHNTLAWYYTFKPIFGSVLFFVPEHLKRYIEEMKTLTLQTETTFRESISLVFRDPPDIRYVSNQIEEKYQSNYYREIETESLKFPIDSTVYLFVSSHMYPDTTFQLNFKITNPVPYLRFGKRVRKVVGFINGCCSWSWNIYFSNMRRSILFTSASDNTSSRSIFETIADKSETKIAYWSDFGRASFIAVNMFSGERKYTVADLAREIKKISKSSRPGGSKITKPQYGAWPKEQKLEIWYVPKSIRDVNWSKLRLDRILSR